MENHAAHDEYCQIMSLSLTWMLDFCKLVLPKEEPQKACVSNYEVTYEVTARS